MPKLNYKYRTEMKYLGIYQSFQPIIDKTPRLFAFVGDIQVIIHYDAEHPFYVEQIAVLLDSHRQYDILIEAYDVFECGIHFETDTDAKAFGVSLAENLIKYRRELLKYFRSL